MSNPNAARLGGDIIHTSILANMLEGAFEAVICVAIGVIMIAAATPLAVAAATAAGMSAATVAAASVAATTCTVVGIVGGLTVSLSGATEVVGDTAQGAANFTSPPLLQGKIATGSLNVQTNGLPVARTAGRLMTAAENATREKIEAKEKTRREEEDARISTGVKVLNGVSVLFSYGGEPLGELISPAVAGPSGGVVEAEHDVVLCEKHPPNPIQFIAEGSSQVSINGLPAVRTGDRTACGGAVSMVASPNVIVGGKPVVARPIHSGKLPGVETVLLALSVLTCHPTKLLKQLPCMIMGMAAAMLASKIGESVRVPRNPIHAVTGAKVLNGEEDCDFKFPARFPLIWQRIYNSCDPHEGLLGRGWRTAFETRVIREEEYTCFHDEEGRELRFVCPPPGGIGFSSDEGLLFAQSEQGMVVIGDLDGVARRLYLPHPLASSQLRLHLLSDNCDNGLRLHYDEQDRLQAITDTQESLQVVLHYQDLHSPQRSTRITERMLTPAPPGGEPVHWLLMSYDYTPQGEPCRMTDADDVCLRGFDYTPDVLMAGHRMPGGARHRYQQKKFSDGQWVVAYESSGGDSATIGYNLIQGMTTVTHGGDETHRHEWDHRYLVEKYTDESGQVWGYDQNEDGQFSRTVDPLGASKAYHYGNTGNMILEADPLGRAVCTR